MTSPKPEFFRRLSRGALVGLALTSIALAGAGCQKKKKPAPPPPPPPKPVAVIPDPIDVSGLLQTMKPDARVQFPPTQAPADRTLAEGVIRLADSIAKGDAAAMKPLLASNAQNVLDELVSDGGWTDGTKPIEQVRVVSLSGTQEAQPTDSVVGLAIQGKDGAYLLAWSGKRDGDKWVFNNAPCQGDVKPRASDFDGVSIATSVDAPAPVSTAPTERPTSARGTGPRPAEPGAGSSEPAPSGGRTKSTPAGPIKIPGGG